METAFSTTPLPAPAKRRRRWLRGVLILLALVILAPLGCYAYLRYTAGIAWDLAEAEADRLDPDWRMAPLLLKRRAVPDEENSALMIVAAVSKVKDNTAFAVGYGALFDKLPSNARLNHQQMIYIRGELGKNPESLAEFRGLKNFPYGRFPVKMAAPFFATRTPDHQKPRAAAQWLYFDAFERAQNRQFDEAIESCRAGLCSARSMGDEPLVIAHRIRMAIHWEPIEALERVLGQGEASAAALEEMQRLLALEIEECTWLPAVRGERAGYHEMFDALRAGTLPSETLGSFRGVAAPYQPQTPTLDDWLVDRLPTIALNDYPEFLQNQTRLVEIAKLPLHEQRPKVRVWDEANRANSNRVARLFAYPAENILNAECRSQALLRCAMTAIACERYRLQHKTWPASLDVLVEKKLLNAVPLDPIDGKPLRYRNDKGLVTIYSIGNDEKDDGGRIDRTKLDGPGVDIGFRLWALAQRGVAPP